MKCRECHSRPARRGRRTCQECTERAAQRKCGRIAYVPIDEWLEQPRNKILRALRRQDWVTANELGDIIGIPPYGGHGANRERDAFAQVLYRLVRQGFVDVRKDVTPREYRLNPNLPSSVFEPPFDNEVIADLDVHQERAR